MKHVITLLIVLFSANAHAQSGPGNNGVPLNLTCTDRNHNTLTLTENADHQFVLTVINKKGQNVYGDVLSSIDMGTSNYKRIEATYESPKQLSTSFYLYNVESSPVGFRAALLYARGTVPAINGDYLCK